MNKWISIVLCLTITASLSGCGGVGDTRRPDNQTAGVNDVLEAGIAEAEGANASDAESKAGNAQDLDGRQSGVNSDAPAPESTEQSETPLSSTEGIDVDLTTLSSTMVYSEVYNMLVMPDKYIGKTIKMNGMFTGYHDERTDKYYFACIIQDATACCSQGIEFVLNDSYIYPDDYPSEGEEITVAGIFSTYKEDKYTYCTLENAELM